jgi:hypothetical protein
LYEKASGEFLSLAGPFSRYLLDIPRGWPVSDRPIRIMLAIANPPGPQAFSPDDVESFRNIVPEDAPRPLGRLLEFVVEPETDSVSALTTAIQVHRPVHGLIVLARASTRGDDPAFFLRDLSKQAQPVSGESILSALAQASVPVPSLVILAASFARPMADRRQILPLIRRILESGVQSVLTLMGPLSVSELTGFTRCFLVELSSLNPPTGPMISVPPETNSTLQPSTTRTEAAQ